MPGSRSSRLAVCLAVAGMLATLCWVWGQLSWKYTGTPEHALRVALFILVLTLAVNLRVTASRLTRKRFAVVVFVPLLLVSCGSSCTAWSDVNPGGGTNFMFANNTPDNATAGFDGFMLGALLIGVFAAWPLSLVARDAYGTALLATSGWLLLSVLGTWAAGLAAAIELGSALVPHLATSAVLLVAARRAGSAAIVAGLAAIAVIALLLIGPWALVPGLGPDRAQRAAVARCAFGDELVRRASSRRITEYAAPGSSSSA